MTRSAKASLAPPDGEAQPADRESADSAATPVPGPAALDVGRVLRRWQGLFGEPIAGRFLPHFEAFRAQQQIAENLIRSAGGFGGLQKQILAAQPQIQALRAQPLLSENVFKSLNAASGLQTQILSNLPRIELFRDFSRSFAPDLAKLASLVPAGAQSSTHSGPMLADRSMNRCVLNGQARSSSRWKSFPYL